MQKLRMTNHLLLLKNFLNLELSLGCVNGLVLCRNYIFCGVANLGACAELNTSQHTQKPIQTEADREIWLAKDTLNKIKSGNIEKIYKLGGCLPIYALLAKKRASVARDDSVDLFGMTEVKEEDARPMTRVKAQANVEAAMASNDPAAIEKAVDALKEFERKEKAYRDSLNSMTEGHWGAHTLGRTHLEHQLQEAIKNNDAAEVERCVDGLKQMDEASQEDSVSISG